MRSSRWLMAGLVLGVVPVIARAATGGHHDPSAPVALALALVLLAAKLGGEATIRLGQAAVLGELLAGVLLGNLHLVGFAGFDRFAHDPYLDLFARIGVLLLLFEVGLESTIGQMWAVGLRSLLVAVTGIIFPFALGWIATSLVLPASSGFVHAFLAATLTATSVGITARVLKDIHASQTPEARVIRGAAVIDDVLGLVILAVVTGAIASANGAGPLRWQSLAGILGKSVGFLATALAIGAWVTPRLFKAGARLRVGGVLLVLGLSFCLILSWLADLIGLAPIVGAFAAGLILEEAHSRAYVERGEQDLGGLLHPISAFLVPVFFVVMGMRTDLRAFADPSIVGLAVVLTLVAVAGKILAGVAAGRGLSRLTVGIGMIPRGEVGLIFANIGLGLMVAGKAIVSPALFSAVVMMVIVTTVMTPPLLKWAMARKVAPSSEPV